MTICDMKLEESALGPEVKEQYQRFVGVFMSFRERNVSNEAAAESRMIREGAERDEAGKTRMLEFIHSLAVDHCNSLLFALFIKLYCFGRQAFIHV